jgi:3-deoxy-D-manno-octulosonate 8-phosphate phosphatase KdsC-like HAD superfamily phosphatase
MTEQKPYQGWTILVDADGTLTDGKKHINEKGERVSISFHSRDAVACKMLVEMGFQVIIVTNSFFPGIPAYWEKYGAKVHATKIEKDNVISHFVIDWQKTIGIGDDITDICYLEKCRYVLLPKDCHKQLIGWFNPARNEFAPVSKLKGGQGLLSQLHELIHFHKILK